MKTTSRQPKARAHTSAKRVSRGWRLGAESPPRGCRRSGWGFLLSAACGWLLTGQAVADALWLENPLLKARNKVPLQVSAFPLKDVRLLDGPFKRAMELDRAYLLSLDVDRLLHTFRLNAGLPSSAKPLGGWEEPRGELRGHFAGHYLTACALMYASTGDERLKAKAESLVAGLAECQAKFPSGYLSAFPEEFFDRVEARQRVWAPYYTLHKILAGLQDVYVYCGHRQALEVATKLADWVIARNSRLTDEQMQRMLDEEHGGMNETLANLYGLTGEEKYLKIAFRFNHQAVIGPAARREDRLTGLHANTQIPKFIGTARLHELTGEAWLRTASEFFWETVARERSYVIGGHSDGEMFSPKERLSEAFGPNTTETCNTYNMLKLTRHLFAWEPRADYADFYERALLNHILASQHPETGMMCYYVPLRPGSRKTYNEPLNSFWCCTGTGIENHAKYGDSIYFHDGPRALYVNLFIASELNWPAKGLKLLQDTPYPDAPSSRLVFRCEKPVELSLYVRHPWWAEQGLRLKLNGTELTALPSAPGSFAMLSRTWKDGDTLDLFMPFSLRTEGFKDNPRRLAFLHGPVVLAAQVDPQPVFPVVVAEPGTLPARLQPVPDRPHTFTAPAELFHILGETNSRPLTLEPFYQIHGQRTYTVYFDALTPAQWEAKLAEHRAQWERQKALEARTVDFVSPASAQREREHGLQGERMAAGQFNQRAWRHATEGGWFSYQLKVQPDQPQELWVTYWGSDVGNRVFDVLVDGQKLATQRLQNNRPNQFYDEVYPLPAALLAGKTQITVKFQAHPGAMAGGVFGVRVVKPAP